jgi:hypothetical protein
MGVCRERRGLIPEYRVKGVLKEHKRENRLTTLPSFSALEFQGGILATSCFDINYSMLVRNFEELFCFLFIK